MEHSIYANLVLLLHLRKISNEEHYVREDSKTASLFFSKELKRLSRVVVQKTQHCEKDLLNADSLQYIRDSQRY
jgi:hypothetical protein